MDEEDTPQDVVHPEVRAHINSLVSAVSHDKPPIPRRSEKARYEGFMMELTLSLSVPSLEAAARMTMAGMCWETTPSSVSAT